MQNFHIFHLINYVDSLFCYCFSSVLKPTDAFESELLLVECSKSLNYRGSCQMPTKKNDPRIWHSKKLKHFLYQKSSFEVRLNCSIWGQVRFLHFGPDDLAQIVNKKIIVFDHIFGTIPRLKLTRNFQIIDRIVQHICIPLSRYFGPKKLQEMIGNKS